MISPTLFIGLGSTGLNILQCLQEMVLEHYGQASLPIFRYIAIESRESAHAKALEWGENHIKVVTPVIANTKAIANSLKQGGKGYLDDWLDPRVLDVSGSEFKDGAANLRMAGRLILMENWGLVAREIAAGYEEIKANANINAAKEMLVRHYGQTGQAYDKVLGPVDTGPPSVYVFGTLCGGTCSGMFIDIAFYTKYITGLFQETLANPFMAKMIGVFTGPDSASFTRSREETASRYAGNCWAALMEYDFFCHPKTQYRMTFPDATGVHTNEAPLDVLYLLTCSAIDPQLKVRSNFRNRDGSHDKKALEHMAATLLFSETVGALLEHKQAIRTNFKTFVSATNQNRQEHSPCLYTCGMATVWYPKYRIALGSACLYAREVCKNWIGELPPDQRDRIAQEARDDWRRIFLENSEHLLSTSKGTLFSDIEALFEDEREADCRRDRSEFRSLMTRRLKYLEKNNRFDQSINDPGRLRIFENELLAAVLDQLQNRVNSSNLNVAKQWLVELDSQVKDTLTGLPRSFPSPDLKRVDIDADLFCRLVFNERSAEAQRKEEVLWDTQEYMVSQLKRIANYRLRPVLENLRRNLGVEGQLQEEEIKAGVLTLSQRLAGTIVSLELSMKQFERRHQELCGRVSPTQDVQLVFQSEHDFTSDESSGNAVHTFGSESVTSMRDMALKEEIDVTVAKLKRDQPPTVGSNRICRNILLGERVSEFLAIKENEPIDARSARINTRMIEVVVKEVLGKQGQFDVAKYVNTRWAPHDLSAFAKHGLPHAELAPGNTGLASLKLGSPVSFLAGKNPDSLKETLERKLRGTECDRLFEVVADSAELGHMMLFYREEGLMYLDENLAAANLFNERYAEARSGSTVTLHSHKKGRIAYDPLVYSRRDELESELMPIATKVLAFQDKDGHWVESGVFEIVGEELVYTGEKKNKEEFVFRPDQEGISLCAEDEEVFSEFKRQVVDKLDKMSNDELIERINSYLRNVQERQTSQGKDGIKARQEENDRLKAIPRIAKRLNEA